MSCSLPPEIIDLIIDHLHNERNTLKACCLVAKSWVPRGRKHLFARVEFGRLSPTIYQWMKAFPNPSNSPAHHTRDLFLSTPEVFTITSTWILRFNNIETLRVCATWEEGHATPSLVQLQKISLSRTLKSLHLSLVSPPLLEVFNLICSFPILENLTLYCDGRWGGNDEWVTSLTSPKLTGSLCLVGNIGSATRVLLGLPGGLRFTKIVVTCYDPGVKSVMDLISGCSGTLESLWIDYTDLSVMPQPPRWDISEARQLKDVVFQLNISSGIQWTVQTIQTARLESLRQIAIFSPFEFPKSREWLRRGWQELDHLLVRLWVSHGIVPKITFQALAPSEVNLGELASTLLPELTNKGFVCEVCEIWEEWN